MNEFSSGKRSLIERGRNPVLRPRTRDITYLYHSRMNGTFECREWRRLRYGDIWFLVSPVKSLECRDLALSLFWSTTLSGRGRVGPPSGTRVSLTATRSTVKAARVADWSRVYTVGHEHGSSVRIREGAKKYSTMHPSTKR